jgi:hypothetical protein
MHLLPRCAASLFSIAALFTVCAGGVVAAASANAAPAASEPSPATGINTPQADLPDAPGAAPVPEGETHALLLIGVGLVGCIARRRGRGWRNRAVFDSPAIRHTQA